MRAERSRSWRIALGATGVVSLSLIAIAAIAMLTLKLADPVHAGVWRDAHQFVIGKIADPASATELLGSWLYPLCVGVVPMSWATGRFIRRVLATRITPARRSECQRSKP
ncbi:MAG TPA: hypothetical protein VFS24_01630 [Steroidobacteraceae bacterium]|nr:hypothetical protein [Steroidobacteraceae bacterium]